MRGKAYINGADMWDTWGAVLGKGAYEALLTPAPVKEVISSKSRLEHGKQVIASNMRVDERDLTLSVFVCGKTRLDFLLKYRAFVDQISSGVIALKITDLKTTYHLSYLSCSSYGDYGQTKAKLVLKLNEPNPKNREAF